MNWGHEVLSKRKREAGLYIEDFTTLPIWMPYVAYALDLGIVDTQGMLGSG